MKHYKSNLKGLEFVKEDDVVSIGEFDSILRLKGVPLVVIKCMVG